MRFQIKFQKCHRRKRTLKMAVVYQQSFALDFEFWTLDFES